MDIEKQVQYWRDSVIDDIESVDALFKAKKVNQGLFFAHLSVEKALKAIVCRETGEHAPYTHNLDRLAKLSNLELSEDQIQILAQVSPYNLRGRYSIPATPLLTMKEAREITSKVRKLVKWLNKK
jgi:HEPN domain-containing protein